MKQGDLVKLKSGGPKMTVEEMLPMHAEPVDGPNTLVKCSWFSTDQKRQTEEFRLSSLAEWTDNDECLSTSLAM